MSEIDPCKCGGQAEAIMHPDEWWYVRCTKCRLRNPSMSTRSDAIGRWNYLDEHLTKETYGVGETSKTLRDEFAMAALTGLLAADLDDGWRPGSVAEHAYSIADAMLEARKVKPEVKR